MNEVDEEELRLLLDSDLEHEMEEGLGKLIVGYQLKLASYIRSLYPGIPTESINDILQAVFMKIWRKVSERNIDISRPLHGLIYRVTKDEACDFLRKISRHKKIEDAIIDNHLEISHTISKADWDSALIHHDRDTIKNSLAEMINGYSVKKGIVALAMLHFYPDAVSGRDLIEFISKQGHDITTATAYRIKAEIHRDFKGKLEELGYGE